MDKKRVLFHVDFRILTVRHRRYLISEILEMPERSICPRCTRWTYSKELLVANDPDLIIMTTRWGQSDEETRQEFIKTKPYSDLRATKEGNLIFVDSDMISRQGPRSAMALEELAKAIHGEDWL